MHTAFEVVEIPIEKLPKIECLALREGRILAGTSEGSLYVLEVTQLPPSEGRSDRTFRLVTVHFVKNFVKRAISQLITVSRIDRLLTLSDGQIYVHCLSDLSPDGLLSPKLKGVTSFSVNVRENGRVDVVLSTTKKMIIFLVFDEKQMGFVETKSFGLPDVPKSVLWCGSLAVCLGFRKEYLMFDVSSGQVADVFPTGRTQQPLCCALPQSEILLGRDCVGVTVGSDGKPTRKFGISWGENPLRLLFVAPYVLSLFADCVDVRSLSGKAETQVQRLSSVRCGVDFCAAEELCGSQEVFVFSASSLFRIRQIPITKQIEELLTKTAYEDAIALGELLPPSAEPQRDFLLERSHTSFGFHLFSSFEFSRAVEEFLTANLHPLMVVALFPAFRPLFAAEGVAMPVCPYFSPDAFESTLGEPLETQSLTAAVYYLTQKSIPLRRSAEDDDAAKGGGGGGADTAAKKGGSRALFVDEKEVALVGEIIDTALLIAYLRTSVSRIQTFVKFRNRCNVKIAEKELLEAKMFGPLVEFFRCRNLHRDALLLLKRLSTGWEGGEAFRGVAKSVEYLSRLGLTDRDLIFEFSKWTLKENFDASQSIFVSPDSLSATEIPPDDVLRFISAERFQPLLIPYLEFCVAHHLSLSPLSAASSVRTVSIEEELIRQYLTDNRKYRTSLLSLLRSSDSFDLSKVLAEIPDDLAEERAAVLSRLGHHEDVLEIYLHRMESLPMAVDYCREIKREKGVTNAFFLAAKSCLSPPDATTPLKIDAALSLLEEFAFDIQFKDVAEMLPLNIPLSRLRRYFEILMKENSAEMRSCQVLKNLRRSENQQEREQWVDTRRGSLRITYEKACHQCHKRIGLSAFAFYPNGSVVHLSCRKEFESLHSGQIGVG